jgi:hypothetical protein
MIHFCRAPEYSEKYLLPDLHSLPSIIRIIRSRRMRRTRYYYEYDDDDYYYYY